MLKHYIGLLGIPIPAADGRWVEASDAEKAVEKAVLHERDRLNHERAYFKGAIVAQDKSALILEHKLDAALIERNELAGEINFHSDRNDSLTKLLNSGDVTNDRLRDMLATAKSNNLDDLDEANRISSRRQEIREELLARNLIVESRLKILLQALLIAMTLVGVMALTIIAVVTK